jgi:hypothetical protein
MKESQDKPMSIDAKQLWINRHIGIFMERMGPVTDKEIYEKVFEYLDSCNSNMMVFFKIEGGFETLFNDFIKEIKTYR